jgi:hypothetical protein
MFIHRALPTGIMGYAKFMDSPYLFISTSYAAVHQNLDPIKSQMNALKMNISNAN